MNTIPISNYFNWEDVTRSDTADRLSINNTLPIELKDTAVAVAKNMDMVRLFLSAPIIVYSWYRCIQLNRLLNSKDTSQHIICQSVDFVSPRYGSPADVVRAICANPVIKFDQLILEWSWVHISFQTNPAKPRRGQVLTLNKDGTYSPGIAIPK